LARPDFRAAAARRLSEERELPPAIVSLLSPDPSRRSGGVRIVPVDRIEPNPQQPRLAFDETSLDELAASIREHGVLQPILVRPLSDNRYQLIAGERRWRASRIAGHAAIPALVEEIDDETALEIAIIENLQREDLSPLDEATMYDRMIRDHGYSIRKLAEKLGKDKGYLENRLRLADAPPEVRQLVSLRKDTLSHAYELMKVDDPRKRRRLADQVARNELSLVKLRERIEGRTRRPRANGEEVPADDFATDDDIAAGGRVTTGDAGGGSREVEAEAEAAWTGRRRSAPAPIQDDSLVLAKRQLNDAVEDLLGVLRSPDVLSSISQVDRANLVKYLTIAKLRLENAIAAVRTGEVDQAG
jgi:ParB/RepB/Spo0J family partition protein